MMNARTVPSAQDSRRARKQRFPSENVGDTESSAEWRDRTALGNRLHLDSVTVGGQEGVLADRGEKESVVVEV